MNFDLMCMFGMNVIVNSFLIFFTLAFLTKAVITLFRMGRNRFAYWMYFIPVLKLPLSLLSYNFSTWALSKGVNPLTVAEGSRNFNVGLLFNSFFFPTSSIGFTIENSLTFSIADLLTLLFSTWMWDALLLLVTVIAIVKVGFYLMKLYVSYRHLKEVLRTAERFYPLVYSKSLSHLLQKNRVEVYFSSEISTPQCAIIKRKCILLPVEMKHVMTQDELEVILAHELAHLENYDMYVSVLADLIANFFWWVPMRWWLKNIAHYSELSCDKRALDIGYSRITLAQAIQKVAQNNTNFTLACCFRPTYFVLDRVKTILEYKKRKRGSLTSLVLCALGLVCGMILISGKLWIF